ncbi:MAG: hypothetical protein M1840_000239 [Geoglossum simile]|nr:MAG: hypothetical protein M1840_000239 [Geoglossum simile]
MDNRVDSEAASGSLVAALDSAERELSVKFAALADGTAASENAYSEYNIAASVVEALKSARIDDRGGSPATAAGHPVDASTTYCTCRGICCGPRCACINAGYFCGFLCRKGVHHKCKNVDGFAAAPHRWPQPKQEEDGQPPTGQGPAGESSEAQTGEAVGPATSTNSMPLSEARPTRVERRGRRAPSRAARKMVARREARERGRRRGDVDRQNRLHCELGIQKYSWMTGPPPPA